MKQTNDTTSSDTETGASAENFEINPPEKKKENKYMIYT